MALREEEEMRTLEQIADYFRAGVMMALMLMAIGLFAYSVATGGDPPVEEGEEHAVR